MLAQVGPSIHPYINLHVNTLLQSSFEHYCFKDFFFIFPILMKFIYSNVGGMAHLQRLRNAMI